MHTVLIENKPDTGDLRYLLCCFRDITIPLSSKKKKKKVFKPEILQQKKTPNKPSQNAPSHMAEPEDKAVGIEMPFHWYLLMQTKRWW